MTNKRKPQESPESSIPKRKKELAHREPPPRRIPPPHPRLPRTGSSQIHGKQNLRGSGSSTGNPRKENQVTDFISLNFPDEVSKKRYFDKFANCEIKYGRGFDLVELENYGFPYSEHLKELGWYDYVRLNTPWYPSLVRAFYANAKVIVDKENPHEYWIETKVNGQEIKLTKELLEDHLWPDEPVGERIDQNEADFDKSNFLDEYPDAPVGRFPSVNILGLWDRVLHSIITWLLRPLGAGYSVIHKETWFFMCAIKKKKHLQLSTFVLHDMKRLIQGDMKHLKFLHYARLISQILLKEGVNLDNCEKEEEPQKSKFSSASIKKQGYKLVDGQWVKKDEKKKEKEEAGSAATQGEKKTEKGKKKEEKGKEKEAAAKEKAEEGKEETKVFTNEDLMNVFEASLLDFQRRMSKHFNRVHTRLDNMGQAIFDLHERFVAVEDHLGINQTSNEDGSSDHEEASQEEAEDSASQEMADDAISSASASGSASASDAEEFTIEKRESKAEEEAQQQEDKTSDDSEIEKCAAELEEKFPEKEDNDQLDVDLTAVDKVVAGIISEVSSPSKETPADQTKPSTPPKQPTPPSSPKDQAKTDP